MRKMIHIATASRDALERLATDSGKSFQDLIDEAIADLLKKHKTAGDFDGNVARQPRRRRQAQDGQPSSDLIDRAIRST